MEIKNVSVDLIVPYEHNPRINEKSISEVAKSIKEFGWQQPIVVDRADAYGTRISDYFQEFSIYEL